MYAVTDEVIRLVSFKQLDSLKVQVTLILVVSGDRNHGILYTIFLSVSFFFFFFFLSFSFSFDVNNITRKSRVKTFLIQDLS